MDGLRLKLEGRGLVNITYMVVNSQGPSSQQLHHLLKQNLENITLYQQEEGQADVWKALDGEKDDFLIYDRCGRLTYHISLPYSILGTPYVEDAITETYCKRPCGDCKYESSDIPAECNRTAEVKPEEKPAEPHHHRHPHHHGHGHGHHHGNRGEGHGHGASHGGQQQLQHDHLNVGQQEQVGQQAMHHQVMQKP